MSAPVSLRARVEQYLAERRKLGFSLNSMELGLFSFTRYVASSDHHGPLSVDLMASWARQATGGSGDRSTWARRLKLLRPFASWLRQYEPDAEVPDEAVFGQVPGRMTPHIYREEEVLQLLAAARLIGPDGGLRPLVMETLFGLIACTGLRISEALGLLDVEVDLRAGVLTIRQSKFGEISFGATAPERRRGSGALPHATHAVCAKARPSCRFSSPVVDVCWVSTSETDKSTASSRICGGNWAGLTAAVMARRASTTCVTPSLYAGWSSGMSRALTWASECWRCRPTSDTSRSPVPIGT